ncbi:MAG: hypothetical protein LBG17_02065 [Bacteroidales bacterium]|jgi:hypothetical protein|nr:hypothetical protein [Bacteroidales bacterium]
MILRNILRFFILAFVQGAILSQISLPFNLHIFLYIYFILLLPYQTPPWLLLSLGFASGAVVDILAGVAGLFAFSATLAAFTRIIFIRAAKINDLKNIRFRHFFFYTFWVCLTHSAAIFMLDAFSFSNFGYTLFLIISSTILSTILIVFCNAVFAPKNIHETF